MHLSPTKDLLIVLVIVLLIFGPKRLPALGRDLGAGLREFKDSITGGSGASEDEGSEVAQPALQRPSEPVNDAERSPAAGEAAPKRD
ncbi:MAG TPA: twin-arginine translocase TatA/TatE family subunit [Solirubrobacteraceae bacterium]|nr:twin-arginine translocase TatA/TatE family subunit [Solirubrobacteraceae bacterium]